MTPEQQREAAVQAVVQAVGGMIAFPEEPCLGVREDDQGNEKRDTLNEFMANTWIEDKWPALLRCAAEAAVDAVSAPSPATFASEINKDRTAREDL